MKIHRSEVLYNRRLSEQDRQREIKRQQAFRDVKETADRFRALPTEPEYFYQNSTGDPDLVTSFPVSLCSRIDYRLVLNNTAPS